MLTYYAWYLPPHINGLWWGPVLFPCCPSFRSCISVFLTFLLYCRLLRHKFIVMQVGCPGSKQWWYLVYLLFIDIQILNQAISIDKILPDNAGNWSAVDPSSFNMKSLINLDRLTDPIKPVSFKSYYRAMSAAVQVIFYPLVAKTKSRIGV